MSAVKAITHSLFAFCLFILSLAARLHATLLFFLVLLLSDHDGALPRPDSVPEAQEGRARSRYQSASLNARSLGPQALSS